MSLLLTQLAVQRPVAGTPAFWKVAFDRDVGSGIWQGAPRASALLTNLLGRKPRIPRQWGTGNYDDAAVWVGGEPLASPQLANLLGRKPFFAPQRGIGNYDDAAPWSFWLGPQTQHNLSLYLPTPAAGPPSAELLGISVNPISSFPISGARLPDTIASRVRAKLWRWDYDEGGSWQGAPIDSALLRPLLTAGGIVRARQWRWDQNDDYALWQGEPLGSALLHPLLTAAGQARAKQWHYDVDDASTWTPAIYRNKSLVDVVAAAPFKPVFFKFGQDDGALWQGAPIDSAILHPLLTAGGQPPTKQWHYDFDDAAVWSPTLYRNKSLTDAVAPFAPTFFRFGQDDSAVWQGQPTKSALLASLLAQKPIIPPQWGLDNYDDAATWPFAWQQRNLLIGLVHAPLIPYFWKFGQDDAAHWQGKPTASAVLATLLTAGGKPFQNPQYVLHDSGASDWARFLYPPFALIVTPAQVAPPTHNWAANYTVVGAGNEPIWVGKPFRGSQPIPPPPLIQERHDMPFFATPGQLKSW